MRNELQSSKPERLAMHCLGLVDGSAIFLFWTLTVNPQSAIRNPK